MVSRREALTGIAASGVLFSGCSSVTTIQPEIRRDLGFRREEKFHKNQPELQRDQPWVHSYLIDEQDKASNLNWDMLLKGTARNFQQTDYEHQFMVLLVGVVSSGKQISTNDRSINKNTLSFKMEVTGESDNTETVTYSYRLQKWSEGTLTNTKSVESTLI